MARSEMRGGDTATGRDAAISAEVESQAEELVGSRAKEEERSTRRFGASRVLTAADRDRILKDAREVEFPVGLRRRLIEDMRAVGEQLVAIGETEGKRFPRFGEEGSEVAELLRDPGSRMAARLLRDEAAVEEKSNGSAEVVPG